MSKKDFNTDCKTITLNAQVTISRGENGVDYIQVIPDDPCEGLVKPFSGIGYGQLLSSASFDFTRKKRVRYKPILKLEHSSVSYGADGFDRYVFVLPNEQREEFAKLLKAESVLAIKFLKDIKKA